MVEIIDTIEDLLVANWNSANTTSRTPLIKKIWEANNFQPMANQTAVLLYEAANELDYPSLSMKWKDENWIISIEIRTSNREQMILIDTEVMRILDENITDIPNCGYMEPRGRRDLIQDVNKPFFRMVRDVKLIKLSIVT